MSNWHMQDDDDTEGDPDDWTLVNAPTCDDAAVLAICEGSGTNAQKKAALSAYFKEEVKVWGIDESDDANEQLLALVSLPVTVGL